MKRAGPGCGGWDLRRVSRVFEIAVACSGYCSDVAAVTAVLEGPDVGRAVGLGDVAGLLYLDSLLGKFGRWLKPWLNNFDKSFHGSRLSSLSRFLSPPFSWRFWSRCLLRLP